MARETKVGLLLGLGVVFLFMCILQWRFGGRAHAELGDANTGSSVEVTKAAQGGPHAAAAADYVACNSATACSDVAAEQPLSIADLHNGLRGRDDEHGLMTTSPADSNTITAPVVPDRPETAGGPGQRPGSTAESPEVGSPATTVDPGTAVYIVKPGDSFSKIAKSQGVKTQDIVKLNPAVDSTKMKTGTKLVIPVKATTEVARLPARGPASTAARDTTPAGQRTYTVAKGDSLGLISTKMYGTCKKTALIASANKGLNPNSLKVGTKLVIPPDPSAAAGPSAPTVAPSSAPAPLDTDTMMAGGAPRARGAEPLVDPSAYPDHIEVRSSARPSDVAGGPSEVVTPGPAAHVLPRTAPSRTAPPAPTTDTAQAPDVMGPPVPSEGMAYRETPAPATGTPHALASTDTYKVQPTDSLYTISKKTLGSAARWKEIYDLNRDKLPNPKALAVGQELRLPSAARTVAATGLLPMDVIR